MFDFTLIAISDSAGDTIDTILLEVLAQFPNSNPRIIPYQFISSESQIDEIIKQAEETNALIVHSIINHDLRNYLHHSLSHHNLKTYDLIGPLLSGIEDMTDDTPSSRLHRIDRLNETYFQRIEALEFTVQNDDGKNPPGLLKADIILLGISRTSKTPLSMILANRNLKVANLPLVPESTLPQEIWHVDQLRIIGLTTTPEVLSNYRQERMKAYGLSPTSTYSNDNRIRKELDYADSIYRQLECLVINTATRSIEETASIILAYFNNHHIPKMS